MNNILNDEFNDIEQLMKPKAEFRASDSLKEKTLNAAKAEMKPRRIIRLWPWLAAAIMAGVVFMLLMPPKSEKTLVAEKKEAQAAVKDTIPVVPKPDVLPEVTPTESRKMVAENISKPKKTKTSASEQKQKPVETDVKAETSHPKKMIAMVTAETTKSSPHLYKQISSEEEQKLKDLELEYELQCLNEEYEKSLVTYIEL